MLCIRCVGRGLHCVLFRLLCYSVENDVPLRINACALCARSPMIVNKRVIVEATLYRVDDHIVVYPRPHTDCGKSDPSNGYDESNFDFVVLTELGHDGVTPSSVQLGDFQFGGNKYEIDVMIDGIVHRQSGKPFFPYVLQPFEVTAVGAWRIFTPKAAA
jgi:hypothetical protein